MLTDFLGVGFDPGLFRIYNLGLNKTVKNIQLI